MTTSKSNLSGVGGVLYLVAFCLFLQVLLSLSMFYNNTPVAEQLTHIWNLYAENGNTLDSIKRTLLEIVPLFLGVIDSFLLYLLFSRDRKFPKIFIIVYTAMFIFAFLDWLYLNYVYPDYELLNITHYVNFLLGIIWIPYILKSKRVSKTFYGDR